VRAAFPDNRIGPMGRGIGLLFGLGCGLLALNIAGAARDPERLRAWTMSSQTSVNGQDVARAEITDLDEKAGWARFCCALATIGAGLGLLAAFGAGHPRRRGAPLSLFSTRDLRSWAEADQAFLTRPAGSTEDVGKLRGLHSAPIFREQALATMLTGLAFAAICLAFLAWGLTLIGGLLVLAIAGLFGWMALAGYKALRSPLRYARPGPLPTFAPGTAAIVPLELACKAGKGALLEELRIDVVCVRWHDFPVARRKERSTHTVPEILYDLGSRPLVGMVDLQPGERRTFDAVVDVPAELPREGEIEWILSIECELAGRSTHVDSYVLDMDGGVRGAPSDTTPKAKAVRRLNG